MDTPSGRDPVLFIEGINVQTGNIVIIGVAGTTSEDIGAFIVYDFDIEEIGL